MAIKLDKSESTPIGKVHWNEEAGVIHWFFNVDLSSEQDVDNFFITIQHFHQDKFSGRKVYFISFADGVRVTNDLLHVYGRKLKSFFETYCLGLVRYGKTMQRLVLAIGAKYGNVPAGSTITFDEALSMVEVEINKNLYE